MNLCKIHFSLELTVGVIKNETLVFNNFSAQDPGLRRVKMAWTFLLNSALFFCFKNWCKITS